jgi:hypothetical protein
VCYCNANDPHTHDQVFIEGQRSRSGKSLPPKTGFLATMAGASLALYVGTGQLKP